MTTPERYPDAAEPADGLRRIVAAISSGEVELDSEDLFAVSRLPHNSAAVVQQQFSDMDAHGRFAVLEHLRRVATDFGGYDFTEIFGTMAADPDASVRSLAVSGLALCETAGATQVLLAVAGSIEEEDAVRREAVTALGAIAMRVELGWASSEGAEDVVDTLRRLVEDIAEDEQIRASALAGVGAISESWVPPLIEDAFDSDSAARHLGAVEAMGRSANESWLSVLEGSIVAEDEDERLAAVRAVGEIGSEEGAPMLLELFNDPTASEELIRGAVAALGQIGGEEALEELEQLRTHPDPVVRETAQSALDSASWMDALDDMSDPGRLGDPGGGRDPVDW